MGASTTRADELIGEIERRIEAELAGVRRGAEIAFRCPFHDDRKASASWNTKKHCFKCHGCKEQGGYKKLAAHFGIKMRDHSRSRSREVGSKIVATYDYTNAAGDLLYQSVRYEPKAFRQRQPDGQDGWRWTLEGIDPILYRLTDLLEADPETFVFKVEGEKDADRLHDVGLVATTNPMGAENWRDQYAETLRGRHVVIIPDNDDPGRKHAQAVAQSLFPVAASVRILPLDGLPPKGDVSDWLDAGHTAAELVKLAHETAPLKRTSLDEVKATFARHLHLTDPGLIVVVVGSIAAGMMRGDPVWLLVVGPPGSGKTEHLASAYLLSGVHHASTMTAASLLSGTSQRERSTESKGGLLREIGTQGILILKDFTSVLSMPRDPRQEVLSALREIYDGRWDRPIGTDGGKVLHWEGKVTIIAGVTEAIDAHHAVMGALGERFVLYRMPIGESSHLAARALQNAGHEEAMRAELADIVTRLFSSHTLPKEPPARSAGEVEALTNLADLASWCRSAVIRDGYKQEIILVPEREAPTRIAKALGGIYGGMLVLGTDRSEAWPLVVKVGLDCLPKLRLATLRLLAAKTDWLKTSDVAERLEHPTSTVRRTLEDMHAFHIVQRQAGGEGKADLWRLTDRALHLFTVVQTVPEMSSQVQSGNGHSPSSKYPNTTHDDFSGKV